MRKFSFFAALQYRDIRLFLLGNLISFSGTYMQVVGVAWQVYQLTHSAFFLGILGVVGFIPTLISFLPAGVIVDKFHKKHLMLFCEFILGTFGLFLFFATQFHFVNVWLLFTVLFLNAFAETLEIPARVASVLALPNICPRRLVSIQ